MEIEVLKKLINDYMPNHEENTHLIEEGERYYQNENDILTLKDPVDAKNNVSNADNPLRSADNRISHPWHQLLVDQKASYTMTIPPSFDVEDEHMNEEITKLLGDAFGKTAKDLAISASNGGVGWLHYWRDEEHENFFRYAVVDSKQIIAIYSPKLISKLEGVLRFYADYNELGDKIIVYEFWNDKECHTFYRLASKSVDELNEFHMFEIIDISENATVGYTNVYEHDWPGRTTFIPLKNNTLGQPDLKKYKRLIDVYDKVFSGFVNDVDDIQEIIFVLTNYGGEDKREFLNDLKTFKMIKVDADEDDAESGVDTLAIDIPIEARTKILEMTREAIFTHGQGVDPQRNIGQNNSGKALQHMYSLLELKASMLETEFRLGFSELVRAILQYSGHDPDVKINQTWERTAINDDLDTAEVLTRVASFSSQEALAKSNPIVEDWTKELEALERERASYNRAEDDYRNEDAEKDLKDRLGDDDDGEEE